MCAIGPFSVSKQGASLCSILFPRRKELRKSPATGRPQAVGIEAKLAVAICVAAYHVRRERGPGAVSLLELMGRTDRAARDIVEGVRHAELAEWIRAVEGQWLLTAAGIHVARRRLNLPA
jgi:hypothetical protein